MVECVKLVLSKFPHLWLLMFDCFVYRQRVTYLLWCFLRGMDITQVRWKHNHNNNNLAIIVSFSWIDVRKTRAFSYDLMTPCSNIVTSDKKEVNAFLRVRLSVCLWQDYLKTRAWIWMKCCVSTDVGTWTNSLTFELDPDAGTGLLSPISYALQRGILLRRDTPTYAYWRGRSLQRGVVLKWFYSPRAVGTPLSEVRALYRVPSSFALFLFVDTL